MNLEINVKGLDKILKKFKYLPKELIDAMKAAGKEAAEDVILPTVGLKNYPGETAANQPPTPYYIRGRGMQYVKGNDFKSERLGTQFYVKSDGLNTRIGNRASYAKYVIGQKQAGFMAAIGWRVLSQVALEQVRAIRIVYNKWAGIALKRLGLKK